MRRRGEIERALFLSRLEAPLAGDFRRLYFGVEFCPWALPSAGEYRSALQAARLAGWAFTLALPVLAEPILPAVQALIASLAPEMEEGEEILVSDLGALLLVREAAPAVPLVVGRVLSGQKRGPQILDLLLSEVQASYFRRSRWHAAEAVRLLAEYGVGRVEQDHLLQGLDPLPEGLAGSLHYPFAMVTSSRNCPFNPPGDKGCRAKCGESFRLASPASPIPLLQAGNSQFLRHDRLPGDLPALGIDRLVYHPRLPR